MQGLKGKSALIVGGASGIGKSVLEALLLEDVRIGVVDPDETALQALPLSVKRFSYKGQNQAEMQLVARSLKDAWGGLDFLVFSAAQFIMRGLEASQSEWMDIFDANVFSAAVSVSMLAPILNAGGAIVHVASISGHVAQPGLTTYHATKGAMIALARSQALELASKGIRVNSVSPSTVWTKQTERYFASLGLSREKAESTLYGNNLLKRFAEPAEIARPILFLLSDAASFITGTDIRIDGGYTAL